MLNGNGAAFLGHYMLLFALQYANNLTVNLFWQVAIRRFDVAFLDTAVNFIVPTFIFVRLCSFWHQMKKKAPERQGRYMH